MKLSIIIPAYNEEKNIRRTLESIKRSMNKFDYDFEIIVVSDGSTDRTFSEAKKVKSAKIRVFGYEKNQGKGYALRYGVKRAKGEVITFLDAGGDFHPDHIDRFIKLMEALDADIVIGSKRHPMSKVNYPKKRRFYSWVYQVLIRILFNLKVRDTQTGLKVIKKEVLEKILSRVLVKNYAFDLELLVVANHLGFHKITEAPVILNYNFNSSGVSRQAILKILQDTLAIAYRLYLKKWYDKEHRAKSIED